MLKDPQVLHKEKVLQHLSLSAKMIFYVQKKNPLAQFLNAAHQGENRVNYLKLQLQ